MQLNTPVVQRSLALPPSIALAPLPVGGVKWRRTIVTCEDAQDLAQEIAVASGDEATKIETVDAGKFDFPLYLKRDCDIVFPSGSVELLGIVTAPDMLDDEYDLYLELDGHHITPTFIGRLLLTMASIPGVVAADWALLSRYVSPDVCSAYALRHGYPYATATRVRQQHPRVNDPHGMRRFRAARSA